MKIEIGRYAGFCRGVKHAVDGAFACARASHEQIFTDGELIHNPQTLEMLEQHDVHVLREQDDTEQVKDKVVVIRAHGVPPARLHELQRVARSLRNFTCRDVARVQGIVRGGSRRGRVVLIFGKSDHPEVKGLLGFADRGYVIAGPDDVEALPDLDEVLLVSQTTMSQSGFAEVSGAAARRFQDLEIVNTICDATELRQTEVKELAERSDRVLVIGGLNSSNTRRLQEIASRHTPAHLIESVDDLDGIDLDGVRSLGVTAGASTPDWLIDEVVEEVRRRTQPRLRRALKTVVQFSLYSNVFVALGAYFLSYAVADTIGVPFSNEIAVLVALYYLTMSLLNTYTSRASMRIDNLKRYLVIHRLRFIFVVLFFAAAGGIALIAVRLGRDILLLTMFSVILGVAYNFSYLPTSSRHERILILRTSDVLALKSFVISFAVTLLLNGLPILKYHPELATNPATAGTVLGSLGFYFSLYYVFLLMFTRQALFEMRTAQTDRIAGVSSLLNLMSRGRITLLLIALPTVLLLLMTAGLIIGAYPIEKAKYFAAVGYTYLLVILSRNRRLVTSRLAFELLVESNVYVAGLIALI